MRERLPLVAEYLRSLGAKQVLLFGSLARGDTHEESDVDFLVTGLASGKLAGAAADAWELLGVSVDVIAREHAPPTLIEQADHEGVAL